MDNPTGAHGTTPSKKISRQEGAFDFVAGTFLRLIENDPRVANKKEVLAFWHDFFAHEGVRNNMIQAFSNFLWEVDGRINSARKAGMVQIKEAIELEAKKYQLENIDDATIRISYVYELIDQMLSAESTPEETLTDEAIAKMDLSEVGGGNEDDTPIPL